MLWHKKDGRKSAQLSEERGLYWVFRKEMECQVVVSRGLRAGGGRVALISQEIVLFLLKHND